MTTQVLPEDNLLLNYLDEFVDTFREQLKTDFLRWGDTWRARPVEGQEERIFARITDYWDQYHFADRSIPWMKVVGLAYIAFVRENHPEVLFK